MKRKSLIFLIVVITLGFLLTYSNRAWLESKFQTSGDCGCSINCYKDQQCSIKCPTGKPANCKCLGGINNKAHCYCGN